MERKEYLIALRDALQSGKYPIAGRELFRVLDDKFYLSSKVKGEIEYFLEMYMEYYKNILSLEDKDFIEDYLTINKNWDIANNQNIEGESLRKIDAARKKIGKTAIDKLIELKGKDLSKEDFVDIHSTLLIGTKSEHKVGIKKEDDTFVGTKNEDGTINVSWLPVLAKEVDEITDMFLSYYNDKNDINSDYDRVVRPVLLNNILTGLQFFKDGNSRYGRLLQTTRLWENLDGSITKYINLPLIYPSVQYYPFRDKVREYVKEIVTSPENEKLWEEVIMFHLRRMEDSIYKGEDNLKDYKKKISRI